MGGGAPGSVGLTRPVSWARTTAWTRSRKPRLASRRVTWVLTVLTDVQLGRDHGVGQATRDRAEHVELASGQLAESGRYAIGAGGRRT